MNNRLINISLIGLILLLSSSLIAKSNQASDFKNQMAKLVLKQQVFEDEINDKGVLEQLKSEMESSNLKGNPDMIRLSYEKLCARIAQLNS